MFGIFGNKNKEEALDEGTVLAAGVTAGVAFKLMEKKYGLTPVHETQETLDGCKKTAYKMLSINPDQKSRAIIDMVAVTFAMDESGFADKIARRYEVGDKTIYPDDAQKIWDMTLAKTNEAADFFKRQGKR
jgi:hypothetical protein